MSRVVSPETSDLIDEMLGAVAVGRRARLRIEATESGPVQDLPEADAGFIHALLGIVALSRKIEARLDGWGPISPAADVREPAHASVRELLR